MAKISNYKKYMKTTPKNDYTLLKVFIVSFCLVLIFSTLILKNLLPKVDVSVGDYKNDETIIDFEEKKIIDDRLSFLQREDSNQINIEDTISDTVIDNQKNNETINENKINFEQEQLSKEIIYKVYIGDYSNLEQAKIAKQLIEEVHNEFSPIVKCLDTNKYSLQIGAFKNKEAANALLLTAKQSNYNAIIVEEN